MGRKGEGGDAEFWHAVCLVLGKVHQRGMLAGKLSCASACEASIVLSFFFFFIDIGFIKNSMQP